MQSNAIGLFSMHLNQFNKTLLAIDVFKIALSTFAGAFLAFSIQRWQKNKEEKNNTYSILIRTQACLTSQWMIMNSIRDIYKQEFQKHPVMRRPLFQHTIDTPKIIFNDLVSCFEVDSFNLLFGIERAEIEYSVFQSANSRRNDLFSKYVELTKTNNNWEDLKKEPVVQELEGISNQIKEIMSDFFEINEKIRQELSQFISNHFPNKKPTVLAKNNNGSL